MFRQLLYVIAFAALSGPLQGQSFEEKDYRHYRIPDGLSDNYISGIQQDSTGYIWISTFHGLNRFDGNTFKQFLHTEQANSIPDNTINSMQLLPGNELGLATQDGAQVISTRTLESKNLFIPGEVTLRYWSNACRAVNADDGGNYGVSTKTGFYIFSREGRLKKRMDRFTVRDIGHSWILFGRQIHRLPDGDMLQENIQGLLVYERKKDMINGVNASYAGLNKILIEGKWHARFFFITPTEVLSINVKTNSFDIIDITTGATYSSPASIKLANEFGWQTIFCHAGNNIWTISSKMKGFYLLRIDPVRKTVDCSREHFFSDYYCTSFFRDRQGRFWIGTKEGLFMEKLHPKVVSSFDVEMEKNGRTQAITSLYIGERKIFAGTNHKEIFVLDKQSHNIIHHITLDTLRTVENIARSFLLVDPDTLWLATSSGLVWLHTRNFSWGKLTVSGVFDQNAQVEFFFPDRKKNIWIIPNRINRMFCYDYKTKKCIVVKDSTYPKLKINLATSLAEDDKGRIWIAGDALARWDPLSQNVDTLLEHLSTQKNWKKGFAVMSDAKNAVWTSVNDDGIARITGRPLHFRPTNLLPDYSELMPFLSADKIFLATNNCIAYIDLKELRSIILGEADGLPGTPFTSIYFSRDATDSSIWFANGKTISRIPGGAINHYAKPPSLYITELAIAHDSLVSYPPSFISLNHDQNEIRISYSALNFTDPANMRFAYRMKNKADTSWIETGTQQSILLTNIAPGNYKLQVKSYAYDNKWPEQFAEIELDIRPPFWQTVWFLLIVALVVGGVVYYAYRRRVQQINQRANLDKLLAQTEMKALHAQMNPHFIFNCLNSIKEMVLNNETQQASRYLSKFAHLIRLTLDQSSRPFVSLQHTIDYLQRYLEMEQIRTTNFTYHIEVDEGLQPADILLPPMLIQPFIENAIWHGAKGGSDPMKLEVRFLEERNDLLCLVEDNGIGIETSLKNKNEMQTTHHSIGISNVRHRIQLLNEKYRMNCSLNIEDKSKLSGYSGSGTVVTLRLAVKNMGL